MIGAFHHEIEYVKQVMGMNDMTAQPDLRQFLQVQTKYCHKYFLSPLHHVGAKWEPS